MLYKQKIPPKKSELTKYQQCTGRGDNSYKI